jgi:hypothetical protein
MPSKMNLINLFLPRQRSPNVNEDENVRRNLISLTSEILLMISVYLLLFN